MSITITAKPFTVKAELPGYGIFSLRRMGASTEAEINEKINQALQLSQEVKTKYAGLFEQEEKLKKANDEEGLQKLYATPESKACRELQTEADLALSEAMQYATKKQLELWSSEDPKSLERLFNEFSSHQIMEFYTQVMRETDNG